ncbi:hypothetical protein F5X99DRAFT_423819 [Biscogniauxia marginata]|nr:hypothetical protein F5X99DRAFT_423819 [Biscogniauxia marginata]
MTMMLKRFSMNVIAMLAFGYPMKLQTDTKLRYTLKRVVAGYYMSHCLMKFLAFGKPWFMLLLTYFPRQGSLCLLETMINARLAEDKYAQPDLYSAVIDQLSIDTADAVCLSELRPEPYWTLVMEIRSAFTSSGEIRGGPQLSHGGTPVDAAKTR